MKRLTFISGMLCSWAACAGPGAEKIFADARAYTAYIETRIEVPFIEDEQGSSIGAGFVIDRERHWVLTNAHVSGRSPAHITVMLDGAEPVRAWPVFIDPYLDLAVLEYQAAGKESTQVAKLDCDRAPGTGHPVGAFGHPNGFKFSGTRGVISGRTYRFGADWLQTDAPINGGNSGGPLISLSTGRVDRHQHRHPQRQAKPERQLCRARGGGLPRGRLAEKGRRPAARLPWRQFLPRG